MNTLENQIREFLIQNNLVSIWEEEIDDSTEVVEDTIDPDDISYTASGIKYQKKLVVDFLKNNGYQITPENVEMVAKKFSDEGKIVVKASKKVIKTEIDDAPLDLLEELIPLKTLQLLTGIFDKMTRQCRYRYGMVEVPDLANGTIDIKRIMKEIDDYTEKGWKVKQIFTNAERVQTQSVGISCVSGATTILFEYKEYI